MKPRESRKKVLLRARMRAGATWSDACIVNASSRGFGMQSAQPPTRGTFVEVRKGHHCIVARVVWASGHRFGVRTQDLIDLHAITAEGVSGNKQRSENIEAQAAPVRAKDLPERSDQTAERSRFLARSMEHAWVALAALTAAVFLFDGLQQAFAKPMSRIISGLG